MSEGTIVSPTVIFSSSRSSCRDDALVYIWSGSPTHFFARWIGPFSRSNLSNLYLCICLCSCHFFVEGLLFVGVSGTSSQAVFVYLYLYLYFFGQVERSWSWLSERHIALCRCFWHFKVKISLKTHPPTAWTYQFFSTTTTNFLAQPKNIICWPFLSDPGNPGVRSMGPGLSHWVRHLLQT